ncbi:MAG: FimV/HubP family polar landmark protein [Burkholderiales bacterium]
MGRLTVQSLLGQPLSAQIELVNLQPGEEDTLSARIAPADAFNQAGIEINPVLMDVRFSVERKSGRPTALRMVTSQPVNEPFLEVLVEVQSATGKLIREYSFLLDPPEYRAPKPAAAAPSAPVVAAPAPSPAAPTIESKPITPAAAPAPAAPTAAGTHEVQKGDTLAKIAIRNAQPGVSLNQMLIALFRANQDAFINDNINLLRAGRILTIPAADAAAGIDEAEANRIVRSQAREFADYRSKLGAEVARAPATTTTPGSQTAAGKIAAKPQAAPPAEQKDQLKLSKADPKKPSVVASKAAKGDDAVARDRALKEAQSRVEELEKNVGDLQKLLELKNQQLAQLEKQAGAAKPAPATPAPAKPAPAKPEPAKPAATEAPKPAAAPKPEAAKVEPPKPAAAKPEPAKPAAEAPKAAPKPEAKAAPKPKPKPAPPPPPPPPSIVDQFLENPLALAGLGGVLALLVGYGVFAWRRKKAAQSKFQDSVLGGASAGSASVLNAGAAAEAGAAGMSPDVSVSDASVGQAEPEEVDPIAEADVYMAYGRDAQAEEILKEALVKDPGRVVVLGKLLEIYANRQDKKSFEASALKLKQVTNGEGADWDKAAALGRSIDPGNGLYGDGGGEAPAAPAAASAAAAPTLDFDIGGGGEAAPQSDISLDLGGGSDAPADTSSIDFDLGGDTQSVPAQPSVDTTQAQADSGGLDFDLGGDTTPAAAVPAPEPEPQASGGMDFDLNLDLGGGTAEAAPAAGGVDLSGINLDLGGTEGGDGAAAGSEKWQEVATKLDLAKAYEEMGDKDGARDLLNEVIKDGDAAQQAQAQQMLAALG